MDIITVGTILKLGRSTYQSVSVILDTILGEICTPYSS